jgi:predicted ATP-binding protein involved in virulence
MVKNFSGRSLSSIPSLVNGSRLTELNLDTNKFVRLDGPILASLKSLRKLTANNNQISSIGPELSGLSHLISIYLNSNLLSSLSGLEHLPRNLSSIFLQKNQIEQINFDDFARFQNLNELDISHNLIEKIELNVKFGVKNLILSNNRLRNLPDIFDKFPNLTHLDISNNQIEFLPASLVRKAATKLTFFNFAGNNIPVPHNYDPKNPKSGLGPTGTGLPTNEAFIFVNSETMSIRTAYVTNLFSELTELGVIPHLVTSEVQAQSISTILFFLVPVDSPSDPDLLSKVAKSARRAKRVFLISDPKNIDSTGFTLPMVVEKGASFGAVRDSIKTDFSSDTIHDDMSSLKKIKDTIVSHLRDRLTELKIQKIRVTNAGHFEEFEMDFESDVTCLLGMNGSGKSTLFRSICLSFLSERERNAGALDLIRLCRITNYQNGIPEFQTTNISLDYTFDGRASTVELQVVPEDQGRKPRIILKQKSNVFLDDYILRTLIIHFPQGRKTLESKVEHVGDVPLTLPHSDDLVTAFNGESSSRISSFQKWIADLALKEEKQGQLQTGVVNKVFQILSEVSGRRIEYLGVRDIKTHEVWVSTFDSPKGVPLKLLSHGYQDLMNWLGYLLLRFKSAYPSYPNPFAQPAVVMIDEIDESIHPVWQGRMVESLRKHLPQAQVIFSTHSPICMYGLKKENIRKLTQESASAPFKAVVPEYDNWAQSFEDLLREMFDVKLEEQLPKDLLDIDQKLKDLEGKSQAETPRYQYLLELKTRFNRSFYRGQTLEPLIKELKKEIDFYKQKNNP